jgi:hypothetical protein
MIALAAGHPDAAAFAAGALAHQAELVVARDGGGVQEALNANGYSVHRGGKTVSEAQRRRRTRDGWITWRTPTEELATKLDELGISPIEGGRDVAARLNAMGHRVGIPAIWKAQKLRQQSDGIVGRGSNTDDVIALLDRLDIPPEETVKSALSVIREAGHGIGRHSVERAQTERRRRVNPFPAPKADPGRT